MSISVHELELYEERVESVIAAANSKRDSTHNRIDSAGNRSQI